MRLSEENILISVVKGVSELTKAPLLSFHFTDISVGTLSERLAVKGILYLRSKNAKKFRKGIEYGSARWGTAEDIKPYIDKDFYNNILLTQHGTADNEQPPEKSEICTKQECACNRRLRQRKNKVFCKTESYADDDRATA